MLTCVCAESDYREMNAFGISYRDRMTEEKRAEKRARQRATYAANREQVRARMRGRPTATAMHETGSESGRGRWHGAGSN